MRTAGVTLDSRRDPLTESCLENVPKSTQNPSIGNEFPLSLRNFQPMGGSSIRPENPGLHPLHKSLKNNGFGRFRARRGRVTFQSRFR